MELTDQTALITGGTAGIGLACARLLAREGTSVITGRDAERGKAAAAGINEDLGRALPLGRTAEPEEIAHAVLFLASPRASFITGSTLHADGGGTAI
jgi:NAD(P)-dependent dehydrogenase (short-subunit alcohol dehydrogenase family)